MPRATAGFPSPIASMIRNTSADLLRPTSRSTSSAVIAGAFPTATASFSISWSSCPIAGPTSSTSNSAASAASFFL